VYCDIREKLLHTTSPTTGKPIQLECDVKRTLFGCYYDVVR